MRIAIHDAEMDHFMKVNKFPNYALMKISAYHKALGDTVEWFSAILSTTYDRVYSSKVFDFTPENPYLPPGTIKGGTGYGIYEDLPPYIDAMFPDYSIYPFCDYAIGYITRGCIRNCPWCVVPRKEGKIHPYRAWTDLVRSDTDKLVLMDNNILACDYGIQQLREIADAGTLRIDLNQGMDARLVTPEIADVLAKIRWIDHIRFSCDQKCQIEHIKRVVNLLYERGIKPRRVFVYTIITKDFEDDIARIYALRDCGAITVYAQPEQNPSKGITPEWWQKEMAQRWIYSGLWRRLNWDEYIATYPKRFQGKEYPKEAV